MVFEQGRELMVRIYVYYTVKLYVLDNLYIEIWYRPYSNQIDKVEVVLLDEVIHLYEKNIDISDLFDNH